MHALSWSNAHQQARSQRQLEEHKSAGKEHPKKSIYHIRIEMFRQGKTLRDVIWMYTGQLAEPGEQIEKNDKGIKATACHFL